MLTVEWDKEKLEIHADSAGLKELIEQLNILLKSSDKKDHVHLMTEEWGGGILSSEKQNKSTELIHHVKIFKWDDVT